MKERKGLHTKKVKLSLQYKKKEFCYVVDNLSITSFKTSYYIM